MKELLVTCAIVFHEGKVLVTRRAAHKSQPLKWEFPGGKLEPGETPEACIHREMLEELNLEIRITRKLPNTTWNYPDQPITLLPFVADYVSGEIVLRDHCEFRWLAISELTELDWAPADVAIVKMIS